MATATKSKHLFKREGAEIWWYRFTDPKTGNQVRRSAETTERKLAQERYDIAKAFAYEAVSDIKLDKLWIEASIRWIEERGLKKRSTLSDVGRLGVLGEVMNNVKLSEIDNDFIREQIVNGLLRRRGTALPTINRYIALIRSILNAAYREWKWLATVPYLNSPGQSAERTRKAWITPEQFNRIQDRLSPHISDLMRLAIATGMRYRNLNDLEWNNIDLARKVIFIPSATFKGKRDHVVPLNDTALSVINKYVGMHPDRVFVFKGKPFSRINLRGWHAVLDDLGINAELRSAGLLLKDEKFVFHGLRHTFATWLGRLGTPLEIIELIGGWSQGKARIASNYTHLADVTHLLPYAKKIDLILNGKNQRISTILAHNTRTKLAH